MATTQIHKGAVPYITTEQMIEVDRAMVEDYAIELKQMMENAGRNLAHLARDRFLQGDPRGKTVAVLAGTGGNGGGALVAARRLANYGAKVTVYLTKMELTPVPQNQLDILQRLPAVQVRPATALPPNNNDNKSPDVILDGIIGYSLKGDPRGAAADLIQWANDSGGVPILALDTPSGLDTTTGTAYSPAIRATATMTLALPKIGLAGTPQVETLVGELLSC